LLKDGSGKPDAPKRFCSSEDRRRKWFLVFKAHFFYGSVLGEEGKATEAAEQFKRSGELRPNHAEARLNLGVALIKLGRFAEAHDQSEETLRICPSNQAAERLLAEVQQMTEAKNN
jgi:predicted Zn-dependent protease